MTSGEKKYNKFKEWRLALFPSKHRIHTPDTSQSQSNSGKEVRNLVIDSSIHVTGDHNTVARQDGRLIEYKTIKLLEKHIIRGAAHDDSAREPPPRCHPDTRVKLIARITTWFDGQAQEELLLWITGPAGVGKSAVVQTFAEYLVKSESLGASVFISRPNKRNKPQGIFITIAFQLATRIEDYRNFIVERLSRDPGLLNKGMEVQFMTFIVEPFVEKKIGAGSKRWCIMLDGLDELDGDDAQCKIIKLISSFVQEHRDTPLVWIIASRPEKHISHTFDDDTVRPSCWSEYIPINSTEGCEDVHRFLQSSLQTTRKKYRHCVPSDWPSKIDFLKLTAAASGLFIYAQVVMQFIGYADPVSQLEVLISIIDRTNAIPGDENPFVHLDALYHQILSMVPPQLWPRAKQLLAFAVHVGSISEIDVSDVSRGFQTLRGMSILLDMPQHAIYSCLTKCTSTLQIPEWKVAHKRNLTFLHASFADYLKDSSRSKDFHVGSLEDVKKQVFSSLIDIWLKCSEDGVATALVGSRFNEYCSIRDDKSPAQEIKKFHSELFHGTVMFIGRMLYHIFRMPAEPVLSAQLRKVNVIKLCYYFNARDLLDFVRDLTNYPTKFDTIGLLQEVTLDALKLEHLDCDEMSPACAYPVTTNIFSSGQSWKLHRPRSRAELEAFVGSLQGHSPGLRVVVIGAIHKARVAALFCPSRQEFGRHYGSMVYTIPYSE